jgi:hypothetical protein
VSVAPVGSYRFSCVVIDLIFLVVFLSLARRSLSLLYHIPFDPPLLLSLLLSCFILSLNILQIFLSGVVPPSKLLHSPLLFRQLQSGHHGPIKVVMMIVERRKNGY